MITAATATGRQFASDIDDTCCLSSVCEDADVGTNGRQPVIVGRRGWRRYSSLNTRRVRWLVGSLPPVERQRSRSLDDREDGAMAVDGGIFALHNNLWRFYSYPPDSQPFRSQRFRVDGLPHVRYKPYDDFGGYLNGTVDNIISRQYVSYIRQVGLEYDKRYDEGCA